MICDKEGCHGEMQDGVCQSCGSLIHDRRKSDNAQAVNRLLKVSARLKQFDLIAEQEGTGKDELLRASDTLASVVPNSYEAWKAKADLWLAAILQLESRHTAPDAELKLMGVPLLENDLRDAAEAALRQCAHFAPNVEERIALIDEANRVRKMSWF
jgi:hypothetical protein